jgi:dolichol-phosphate mannosyltransferase
MSSQVSFSANVKSERQIGKLSFKANSSKAVEGDLEVNSQIGVILPTYCEAANIEKLIDEIESLNLNVSIMVIDDSSSDGTSGIVRAIQKKRDNILLLVRPKKSGLGTAITDGIKVFLSLKNPPEYVITMDADYSHNPRDIPRLLNVAKKGYDLVIGSRYFPGGETKKWSLVRIMISKVANKFASVTIGARIKDCTSGLRCYSVGLLKKVIHELHSQTYEIQIETIRQAVKKGCYITEMPITFTNRKLGKSKLTLNEIRQFVSYIARAKLEEYFEIPKNLCAKNTESSDEVLIDFFRTVPARLKET